MKKRELLKYFDDELPDKLFGFCYARTGDSYEAQELCSDIIFALVKAAHTEGEIASPYPFIWRVARNVYADFSNKRRKKADSFYDGDADELLQYVSVGEQEDDSEELLEAVYKRIAFLTKAYREVMIMYYLDGLSTAEIAKRQSTGEGAVRQRLFTARQKIKNEVEEMKDTCTKPLALDKINYTIWGTGDPSRGDPRSDRSGTFSNHIIWLCRKKPAGVSEIAEKLNVPALYVEEELEFLAKGENGEYGLLRRMDNGKYAINFVLLDKDAIEKANAIYMEQLPNICNIIIDFINAHKDEYLSYPYLNKRVNLNLILWQQIHTLCRAFPGNVERLLAEKHFPQIEKTERPFSVFGYVSNGREYGGGWDGVDAENVCGFSRIHLDNIYITRIKKHFSCGLNVAGEPRIQLALRAIDGMDISSLSEREKEHAAKAIECGYLYREGDMLYTKLLVSKMQDRDSLFSISERLSNGFFDKEAEIVAANIAALIKKVVPEHLTGEWRFANILASMPVLDSVVEVLIEKGLLTPPADGIGAEGCWMIVMK